MLIPTPKIISAINLASRLHREHTRKDVDNTPYVSHLFAVAMFLASVTDDEDIIVAGLMHDALEDVADYEYENLLADCGERVANIVAGVTENKTLPYKERKALYLENLKTGSIDSLLVSLADKTHNAMSLCDVHDSHNMNADTQILIYTEVLKIAQNKILDTTSREYQLVKKLEEELESFSR